MCVCVRNKLLLVPHKNIIDEHLVWMDTTCLTLYIDSFAETSKVFVAHLPSLIEQIHCFPMRNASKYDEANEK